MKILTFIGLNILLVQVLEMSDLLEKFDFTMLDIRRSDQLLKEHPDLIVQRDRKNNLTISIGPHRTTLQLSLNHNELPIAHCNCALFSKKGSCHHLYALIIKMSSAEPNVKKQKSRPPKKPPKPSLNKMVHSMDARDLRSFVLQYSKKNKAFSFVLRAKLLRMNTRDNHTGNPYMELMNQLIHQRKHPSSALTQSQFAIFEQIVQVYMDEIELCKVTKDFLNDFQLTIALLDRINLVMFRTPKKVQNLISSWNEVHIHVEELLEAVDAPEFRDEIIQALIELSSKSYYQFCSYSSNVVTSILKHCIDKLALKNLGPVLIEASTTKQEGPWLENHYATIIRVLLETDRQVLFEDFCNLHIDTAHRYLSIARIIRNAGQPKWSNALLYQGHVHLNNMGLHEAFILNSMNEMNKSVLHTALLEHISTYRSILPLSKILKESKKFDRASFLRKIARFNDIPTAILPALYLSLEAPKQLLSAIADLSLEKIPKYDDLLWSNMPSEIRELYEVKIQAYMDQYLGDKALDFMRKILHHLLQQAPKREFLLLKTFIQDTYNHRSGIQKMVGEFQRSLF